MLLFCLFNHTNKTNVHLENATQITQISVCLLKCVEKETDLYKVSPPCFGCVCVCVGGRTCLNVFCIFIVQVKPECKRPTLYAKQRLYGGRCRTVARDWTCVGVIAKNK